MLKCPYNNSCIKAECDLACSEFSEFTHWCNRCNISLSSPAISASFEKIKLADDLIKQAHDDEYLEGSNYIHLSVYRGDNNPLMSDLVSYIAICKYCEHKGFYNGVYKLNFSKYIDEIKKSWTTRQDSIDLENMKIWIQSSNYLVVYNLGLVRFGDFESQTLLTILQDRYDIEKHTIFIMEKGKSALLGKPDSMFYAKLKREVNLRGGSS